MCQIKELRDSLNDHLVTKYRRVVGTGVGNKLVNGENTGQQALLIFVTEKDDHIRKNDASNQLIPAAIDGIPTDVIEVGELVKHGCTSRIRPIVPGYSVGHPKVSAGTLGGVFLDRDDQVVVLSNNHVLACENKGKIGDHICQAGALDDPDCKHVFSGWDKAPSSSPFFGTLKAFCPLQFRGGKNEQDSAIAQVHSSYISSRMIVTDYPNSGPITGVAQAEVGMSVRKFGRTTSHTTGKILGLHSEFTVGYDAGPATFIDCIVTTAMSNGGDSGSLLLTDDMKVLGLLFAGSGKVTLFTPIDKVISRYGLRLWEPTSRQQLEYWGRVWRREYHGQDGMQHQPDMLLINACSNQRAYLETDLTAPLSSVEVNVCSGTDTGASWGPGMALQYPSGTVKLNIRYGDGFGGWCGEEAHSIGTSSPNNWYRLKITDDGTRVVGRVSSGSQTWDILAVNSQALGGRATQLRLGKLDVAGGGTNHNDPGNLGRCQFRELLIS